MTTPRLEQTATLLANGQVLVVGGSGASAELYNPATGKWSATGSMSTARIGYTATVLKNGQVLVAGGAELANQAVILSSAELYNPATGTWTPTGSMTTARSEHTATLLPNGQVLVVCGVNDPGFPVCGADLYNPATGMWTDDGAASPSAARDFTAVLLHDGQHHRQRRTVHAITAPPPLTRRAQHYDVGMLGPPRWCSVPAS